jgi:hypothetical protein
VTPQATIVNAVTSEAPIAPVGHPWLCRAHDRAGGATEPACCALMVVVQRYPERVAWSALRIAAKPSEVQLAIRLTIHDPITSRESLSRHAFASKRWWAQLRAVTEDVWQDGETVNLRALQR